ncbi:family 20 glycosylhydrolase [Bowmanella dokdonensis]|uniref:N-acetyl-beta-glucosaminidase n=1 Tax=Bowmanella dokdonensis TaxID=751969 RepID=A0A939IP07_9ALTE|nr:family 20 glycosylhydrolase [Bowmanella dokdonensis]MBN7826933.1 family 20 glycosylhydrolase [Bowmanella dokdonensis]
MRVWITLTLILLTVPVQAWCNPMQSTLPLMPMPANVTTGQGYFQIPGNGLVMQLSGMSETRHSYLHERLAPYLATTGGQLGDPVHLYIQNSGTTTSGTPPVRMEESYRLQINSHRIDLSARSEMGVLRGVETLAQLLFSYPGQLPVIRIEDTPRFVWRGLLIDSVRHFIPLADIKRQLDGMASAKLNVFHWHLTDDQGWRIESRGYPRLHELASDGLYYSRKEIAELVAYASKLGIRVIPEFDIPGHASAIAVAYPELMAAAGPYQMERRWGVFKPLLDPSKPAVYEFIESIVEELAELFPDPYVHIGGDEVDPEHWKQSASVQAYMQKHDLADMAQLHAHFNRQVQGILARHGKLMMGWDEILHPTLPKQTVVQSWRGQDDLADAARSGFQGVLSTGYYVDQPQSTAFHYRNDPLPAPQEINPDCQENHWQRWKFSIPRLKGKAVTGELSLCLSPGEARAVVAFEQRRPRPVQELEIRAKLTGFQLDTWMGPTRFDLLLDNPQQLQGRVLIGNATYPIQGRRLDGQRTQPQPALPLPEQASGLVLGGEATLWSELIGPHNLDLRLWPRLYAIGERLWSPVSLQEEDNMYRRLDRMSDYGEHVGLQHLAQQQKGFATLLDNSLDPRPLMVLAEAVEQAQYYTRHHMKFRARAYHQQAPLFQYVDYLPAHSLTLVKAKRWIRQLPDPQALKNLRALFKKWRDNLPHVREMLERFPDLAALQPLVEQLDQLLALNQDILSLCTQASSLGSEPWPVRRRLWQLSEVMDNEMVLGAAIVSEALLDQCLSR